MPHPALTGPADSEVAETSIAGGASISLAALRSILARRRRFVLAIILGLPAACLLYCLVAPNQYEATARVALCIPARRLDLNDTRGEEARSGASVDAQLETLANIFRSDRVAWEAIKDEQLYATPGFRGWFGKRFSHLRIDSASAEDQSYLLERFQEQLNVRTLPRTLIVQIRFRSGDPGLSATVVNDLIQIYLRQESDARVHETAEATRWLNTQLSGLKRRVEEDNFRIAAFQRKNGLLETPERLANGQTSDVEHTAALAEVDELNRELVTATADRILREAEYRSAQRGDPELVVASDPGLQAQNAAFATALMQQLRARRSELEQEASQLSTEHGTEFPRVVEIRAQLLDLDRQIAAEDARLVARLKQAWQTAAERENLLRRNLEKDTSLGFKMNAAAVQYAAMQQEANASHELYIRATQKAEEAGLDAGTRGSDIEVVDYARRPVKPVAPDLLVYMLITSFAAAVIAIGGPLLLESFRRGGKAVLLVSLLLASASCARAQAPTPSTSGLPSGVARIPQSTETRAQPNPKDAPSAWGQPDAAVGPAAAVNSPLGMIPVAMPLGPGDVVAISEFHMPEFRTTAQVSEVGSVMLPLIGEIVLQGMTREAAARAIEAELLRRGMLLHPQVTVQVIAAAGLDVSILGEVVRPGVYPLGVHHGLLDLVSAASGLTPNAGSLVTITHRDKQEQPVAVVLSANGNPDSPELQPGDTVQVSRAGLVYVIGDVIRPGGFSLDPSQHLTLVQALTLAWGPTQNAALTRAILIREQKGGRTLTTLNLKRLLRGQDPDMAVRDHDILFVPDSTARNLWNRTMESVVQSAAGVSIYAGLVYSQRF
ncbi:MAG TPA: polysaccharide biosynthesis/export family protein [Terracidiphilus sp.]|nr:polysaccharide biosynthesis/export family protein [Terracidiphilus sp.]